MQFTPSFGSGPPSDGLLHLLQVIETADPNSGAFEEEDLGQNRGHAQFSGWRDTLTKWDDVGSLPMACRLLAAYHLGYLIQPIDKGKGKSHGDSAAAATTTGKLRNNAIAATGTAKPRNGPGATTATSTRSSHDNAATANDGKAVCRLSY
jgi:hypothetical protein